jgi:hypothetical protein
MGKIRCGFCAKPLEPGSLRYVLMWKLFADYDGIIDLEDEKKLEVTMRAVEAASPADLEDQIFMESRHILCPACREEILDTLDSLEHQGLDDDTDEGNGKGERNLH